jgi:hypothetical protein
MRHRISVPAGYERIPVTEGTFADWLRHLPLKPAGTPVRNHDGTLKRNQSAYQAVIDIDVGHRDLQQCADAIMRLKAEYHWGRGECRRIRFNFTSGDPAHCSAWIDGYRPHVQGNQVECLQSAEPDPSYAAFRAYMNSVFTYAGTLSLSRELQSATVDQMQSGDLFIQGGSPGHTVVVGDIVKCCGWMSFDHA